MGDVFLSLLNISITAGWLILAVILLRFLLKKAPKTLNFILWALVALRLIFPFSIESALSLIPSAEPVHESSYSADISLDSGISAVDAPVNSFINSGYNAVQTEKGIDIAEICGIIWAVGLAAMLTYFAVSYLRVKKQTAAKINLRDNIFVCDDVNSPFILGVFRPKIILPSGLSDEQTEYVIRHEKAHLRHRDNLWKPLGYALLAVYWFNPLVWAAYLLLCRDIELACDERVIKNMDKDSVAGYSQALLDCVSNKRTVLACPVAFGEVATKERVKNVLNYKKPAFWIIIIAVIASIIAAVCFMTNPIKTKLTFIDAEDKSGEKILSCFDAENSTEEILNDLKNIDLYYKRPNFDSLNLTVKTETDESSATQKIKYYDGDKLVYVVYKGYGETMFDYCTETASKKDVTVSYVENDGKRYSVTVKGDGYSVRYDSLNKKAPFGADDISLLFTKEHKNDIDESLNIDVIGRKYYVSTAWYYNNKDFVNYYAYTDDGENLETDSFVRFSAADKKSLSTDTIKAINENKDKLSVQTIFGRHKYSYTDNGLKKDWYITADLRVQFADTEKAKAFKESMAAKAQVEDEIEETNGKFFVTVKSVTLPVAENADFYGKDVYEQIVEEINDPTYKALAFNAENQLTGFDTGAEVPDYY